MADQVAALLNNDGQVFRAKDGRWLDEIAKGFNPRVVIHGYDIRYDFPDGSALLESGGAAWDLAFDGSSSRCFCWSGNDEHLPGCPDRQ